MDEKIIGILAFCGVIGVIILINFLGKIAKKYNMPLTLKGCTVFLNRIPADVEDINEYITGKYASRKIKEDGIIKIISNPENYDIYRKTILYPSKEYDELTNNLLLYGQECETTTWKYTTYAFISIPKLNFESEECREIYNVIINNISNGSRILMTIEY